MMVKGTWFWLGVLFNLIWFFTCEGVVSAAYFEYSFTLPAGNTFHLTWAHYGLIFPLLLCIIPIMFDAFFAFCSGRKVVAADRFGLTANLAKSAGAFATIVCFFLFPRLSPMTLVVLTTAVHLGLLVWGITLLCLDFSKPIPPPPPPPPKVLTARRKRRD